MSTIKLKIGTYNLQHGVLYKKRLETGEITVDLSAIAAVLREFAPDVCALNEIYGNEESRFGNQPRQLCEMLGYPYHTFARAIYTKKGEYGNGLLSKFPIRTTRMIPLVIPEEVRSPDARFYEDRVLLIATLDVNGRDLTVMVCHFGLRDDEKALAVDTVLKEAAVISGPIVLLGDFNITPNSVHYTRLAKMFSDTAALCKGMPLTHPSDAPRKKIDYIFTRGDIRAESVTVPVVVASDHLPVFADMELS